MCSRTFAYELRFDASNTKMTACACEKSSSRAGSKARDPPMSRNSTKKKEDGGDEDANGEDTDDKEDEDEEECGVYACRVTSSAQPTVGPMAAEANEVESDGDEDEEEAKLDVSC
jgi:hypothetical protein